MAVALGSAATVGAAGLAGGCGSSPIRDHARLQNLRLTPVAVIAPSDGGPSRQSQANAIDPSIGF